MCLIYEYNLSKAYDDVEGVTEEEGRNELILRRLADYCRESGLDMAFSQRQALFSIALVLFLFIMLINATLNFFLKQEKE